MPWDFFYSLFICPIDLVFRHWPEIIIDRIQNKVWVHGRRALCLPAEQEVYQP